jgi:hypothetical protein
MHAHDTVHRDKVLHNDCPHAPESLDREHRLGKDALQLVPCDDQLSASMNTKYKAHVRDTDDDRPTDDITTRQQGIRTEAQRSTTG